ncbi:sulfotransferase family protein [Nitratireductor luteus]|uniref:sulfotransferase family protein n=1 Tax=Nitratireductor luteus TaxID=2976980 RepID=UPI0022402415|nr:hypothetical protein [Nitratireductor luteus]
MKAGSERQRARKATERYAILVLGMHRSGTSAFTRVLSLAGCDLPKTLMGAHKTNETGHWESTNIQRLNDRILESAGTSWDDWLEFNPGWLRSPKLKEFREEALAALKEQFGSSSLLVLKDPRICRMAPFWLDVLERAGIAPLVVSPIRNPLEVGASLEKRNGFEPDFGYLLWLRHVLDAEVASRGLPRFFASYEQLMKDWNRVMKGAEAALGIGWPRLSGNAAAEIDGFLSERYRHHREAPERVAENPMLSGWLRDTFQIFSAWTAEGERQEDFPVLDRIRAELGTAGPAFGRLIVAGRKAAKKSRELDQALAERAEKAERLEAELESRAHAAAEAEEALAAAHDKLSETDGALAKARQEADRMAEAYARQEALAASYKEQVELLLGDLKTQTEAVLVKAEKPTDNPLAEKPADKRPAEMQQIERRLQAAEKQQGEYRQQIAEKQRVERSLQERFSEIATLTQLLRVKEEQAEWLRQVASTLIGDSRRGRLAGLLPGPLALALRKIQLKRRGLFDGQAYLQAHPDVSQDRAEPLRHYISHGMMEGRRRS